MGTPITDYATLAAAISTWDERSHDADEVIGLAEAEIRNALGPTYAREASATVTTSSSGTASLPSGFIRPIMLTHATYGEIGQRSLVEVRRRIVADTSGIPDIYAISGSSLIVAPIYAGDLSFDYEAILTGLSTANSTNWLMTTAPHIYLSMCMAVAKLKYEDPLAETHRQIAVNAIADLHEVTRAARAGHGGIALPGVTP